MNNDLMILEDRRTYCAVRIAHHDDCQGHGIPHESTHLFRTLAEARAMFPGVTNKWTAYGRTATQPSPMES
ncbi:MAG: hypothetical protein FJY92_05820 [Candidatus Hydrogenedentes bacterium]|nr:hypothetical protein [Candidatus Hydrogenedentota bacterium]